MELKDLGLTEEQIFEAVTDKVVCKLLQLPVTLEDEDGNQYDDFENSLFKRKLQETIKSKIDKAINAVINKHIMPNAQHYIEKLVICPTNQWGEPKGKNMTFTEYLTKRAEEFMVEKVDFDGKIKGQTSYSWREKGTRITYMIDKYLQCHIETWAKNSLAVANKALVNGLQATVELKLKEVLEQLKFEVKTPR